MDDPPATIPQSIVEVLVPDNWVDIFYYLSLREILRARLVSALRRFVVLLGANLTFFEYRYAAS